MCWGSSGRAERCFDDLLLDSRGTRQGFPQSVISEIASLRHYYLTHVFPKRIDPGSRVCCADRSTPHFDEDHCIDRTVGRCDEVIRMYRDGQRLRFQTRTCCRPSVSSRIYARRFVGR